MAFVRDQDAHTRGIGAIAAGDRDPAKQRQRLNRSRQFVRRDRAIARLSGLGAAALNTSGVPTTTGNPNINTGGFPLLRATSPQGARVGYGTVPVTVAINPSGLPTILVNPGPGNGTSVASAGSGPASGSSSGGSGLPNTVTTQQPIITEPPDTTPIPDAATAASSDNTTTYLLLGGAALAAYFLFIRKGG